MLEAKRTPQDPKVAFPVSHDFNECVTLDLKGPINIQKHYILYAIDSFSRLTRGIIVKNKQPESIVRAIVDVWVLGKGLGPGMPGRFYFDNGGEFNNPSIIELAEKYSISMHGTTAANSPYSNGLCERNHAVVDLMIRKIKSGDNTIKDQEALEYALMAKNSETNNKGFSNYQIVYGTNPKIPGISYSNPTALSNVFNSTDVRDHIKRIHLAREAFRTADIDERIKRALKHKISSSNNAILEHGDKVFFKEKENDKYKEDWSGPATALGN